MRDFRILSCFYETSFPPSHAQPTGLPPTIAAVIIESDCQKKHQTRDSSKHVSQATVVDQVNPTAHGTSSPLFKHFGFQIPCCAKKSEKIGIVLTQVLPLTLSKIQENHFKKISTSLPNSLGLTGLVLGPPGQPRLAAPKESMSWPSTVICAKSCGRFAEHPPCFVDHVPHVRTKNPWMFHIYIYILYMYVCMYVYVYIYI